MYTLYRNCSNIPVQCNTPFYLASDSLRFSLPFFTKLKITTGLPESVYFYAEIFCLSKSVYMGCLDLPERLELPGRPPKYRKDQRIYRWTIFCTRDQTNLCFNRAFTATIKAQASLCLPYTPTPIHSAISLIP